MTGPVRTDRVRRTVAAAAALLALAGCSSAAEHAAKGASGQTRAVVGTTVRHTSGIRRSKGCGTTPPVAGPSAQAPGDVARSFDAAGTERTYRLAVPRTYDRNVPRPLILNLHGANSNALQLSTYSDLPRQAAKRGAITITPDAVGGFWQYTPDGTDDRFLVDLVKDTAAHYCVDLDHIHVDGISLGAWKAGLMACRHPDLFASVALVAEEVRIPSCPAMPVIAFHGTADHVVPYGEGADPGVVVTNSNAALPGARRNIAEWAKGGGCRPVPKKTTIGSDIELWTYRGCAAGIDVQLYTIEHGDHTWPGSRITTGPTTHTISATKLALEFFEHHPRT